VPETRTPFQAASEVVAQVALQALLPMLAETISSTFTAKPLEGSVLTNARPNTVSTSKSILAMAANPFANTLSALVFLLAMRTDLTATALSTARAPLQMHTLDGWHSVCNARTKANELDTNGMPQHTFD